MANFTKLNGYDVEDSVARTGLSTLESSLSTNNSFSTNEIDTGKTWIDGKKIYRKVVQTGTFPTGSGKQVAHGITNVDKFISVKCIAIRSGYGTFECCPYYMGYTSDMSNLTFFEIYAYNTYINIDRNPYDSEYNCPITDSYVILEYTKSN